MAAVVGVPALTVAITAAPAQAVVPQPVASTLTSANPVDNTPHLGNGDVRAFAEIGTTVYAGGSFTTARSSTSATFVTRRYLLAYDRATGVINTTFAPVLDGEVHTLEVNPDGLLLVGGGFANVNGVSRRNMVALDPTTGATVTTWVGRGDGGIVRRLVVRGDWLYVAGAFHWINGTQHSLLARLNARTGAIDPTFQIDASVARMSVELVWNLDVSPDGRTLVAVGNFTQVNGLPRNQVVVVDLAGTPTVADWSTQRFVAPCITTMFPFYARDVDFAADGSYFVIIADGGSDATAFCDTISRWETSARGTDLDATWVNRTGRDSVTSLEVADGVIYAAGHFRWVNNANGSDRAGAGAVDRYGYAALNPINGMPLAWNPTRRGAPAGTTAWGPIVWELWRGSAGLLAGFDNDGMGGEYHGRMGMFPLAGGRVIPAVNAPLTTPGFLYRGAGNGRLTKIPFDGTTLGTPTATAQPNLTATGATYSLGNRLYWSKTDTSVTAGSTLQAAVFNRGTAGAPWLSSSVNSWFRPATMSGAFYLSGRLYHTRSGDNRLFYRHFEPDSGVVGCTEFVLPSQGLAWGTVRGMALAAGKIVYGSTDGALRAVPFSDTAIDGASAVVLTKASTTAMWNTNTLFYATS